MSICKTSLLAIISAGLLWGCGSEDSVTAPVEDHEHESITTVRLHVVNLADKSDSVTVAFVDSDGEGGKAPVQPDTLRLRAGASYQASVQFLDESNPKDVHDLNEEIGGAESDDHRIFWTVSDSTQMTAVPSDLDSKGLTLGLKSVVSGLKAGKGSLNINLRHLPGIKTATSGLKDGETDADVDFPVALTAP
ncbi:MAG: hypothetical protein RL318_2920 [Fibrobacterota bacterium]|jgi:hypothetical protein